MGLSRFESYHLHHFMKHAVADVLFLVIIAAAIFLAALVDVAVHPGEDE